MQCFAGCVMLNQFGICESAMRKPEYVEKCPHNIKLLLNNIQHEENNITQIKKEDFEKFYV